MKKAEIHLFKNKVRIVHSFRISMYTQLQKKINKPHENDDTWPLNQESTIAHSAALKHLHSIIYHIHAICYNLAMLEKLAGRFGVIMGRLINSSRSYYHAPGKTKNLIRNL